MSRIERLALALAAFTPVAAQSQSAVHLPEIRVEARALAERADGPVDGYRATRSATFTKTDTPLKEVPASVTVVPAKVIEDASLQSLGDLFRYVPGAFIHQGEGNRDQVVLRGISTTADFFVNGLRDDAQIFRDLYNVERVEVLKGPGGMAFGRGGAGGIVNRVTKRPEFERTGRASFTAGSHDQLRGTIDVGESTSDALAWRVNAMAERAGSFRDGVDLERYAANPAVTFDLGATTRATFDYEHLLDRRTADRGIPSQGGAPFSTDASTFFGNAEQSRARSQVDGVVATIEHDFAGGIHLRNSTRVARYDKFYQNVYPGSAVASAGTLTLSAYNNANERTNVFNQSDFTTTVSSLGFEHRLLAGFEVGHQDSSNRRNTGYFGSATSITVGADAPIATATRFAAAGGDADNNVTSETAALYVQDQVALSPQWKLIAGLRYDVFKVGFDDRRTLVPATDLSRTDRAASPRLGVTWSPNAASTYYASYSHAFLPSGEQLSLASTTADLEPESAVNHEIGARWDLNPHLTLSAALFRTLRNDVRVADPLNAGFFVKSGQQRVQGMELGLQGEVTRDWSIFGGYAYLDGRITRPISSGTAATAASVVPAGNRIGLVPEHSLSVWNRLQLGQGWGAGLGVTYQSSVFTSFNNTVRLPAFTRVDGAVYYTLPGGRTRVALNIDNLLDRAYFPTVDGDNNISPGAPRNARLTVSTTF